MSRNNFLTVFFVVVVMVTLLLTIRQQAPPPFECTDAIGCVDIAPLEPVRLGVLQTLSGGMAPFGIAHFRGIEFAITKRDSQLLRHPLEVQREDEQCSPEGGATAALKVIADPQVVAILGPTCSTAARTAMEIVSEAGLVMVSGGATSPSLTALSGERGADWQPGFFRTRPNSAEQGRVAAIFAFRELGVTKAATIRDQGNYSQEIAYAFERTFTKLGGKLVLSTAVNKGDTDMKPVLAAVAASGTEFIFLPLLQPEADLIVRQSGQTTGLKNIPLMGSGGLILDTFIESVGADGVGMYFVGLVPPKYSDKDELVSEYESRYSEPSYLASYSYAYDAADLLLDAIETVAVQEENGTLHIGRQALRDALYATADFEGVSGKITCDEFGDCGNGKFNIVRLNDPAAGIEGLLSNVIYTYN